ncbi:MAG TPA: site-specific DNA-methyltransferase [Candidatus Gastranaerophilales bacterium]|nr:site-specific DNA-methyltransferase [Candidatus Gastranaerophilales bacterium]
MDLINKLIVGDSLNSLRKLPDGVVDCVVTSPPYWALRNYDTNPVKWPDGWVGELGLEPNFEQYITHLCDIFDEVKRTLKDTGTCWVNIGDTYGGSCMGLSYVGHCKGKNSILPDDLSYMPKVAHSRGKYNKCLLMIPFRFALEMQSRGWIVRNVIIWQKPNCTPQSMKDRFTVDFEYLFFFVKSPKYYFEQQIEPFKESTIKRCQGGCGRNKGEHYQGLSKENYEKIQQKVLNGELKGKNKRAVWNISTSPFRGAHFAVYPPKLIEIPIKAGCPEGGLVLDPFMGSGTTAMVAEKLNRNWLGIELNPEYAQMAEERLKNAA